MTKHTPGPWKANLTIELTPKEGGGYTETQVRDGWIVGVVEYAGCGSHRAEWFNEGDFNLALAAPDLLEALELMVDQYKQVCLDNNIMGWPDMVAAAEILIARARGES